MELIKEIFAAVYEIWVYDPQFNLIFRTLFDEGSYVLFGLVFISVPLLMWTLFYFAWKYPYGKYWHWLMWMAITMISAAAITYGTANSEIFASSSQSLIGALQDKSSGYFDFASILPIRYAAINAGYSMVLGFAYSLIIKRYSKIQLHLPF